MMRDQKMFNIPLEFIRIAVHILIRYYMSIFWRRMIIIINAIMMKMRFSCFLFNCCDVEPAGRNNYCLIIHEIKFYGLYIVSP